MAYSDPQSVTAINIWPANSDFTNVAWPGVPAPNNPLQKVVTNPTTGDTHGLALGSGGIVFEQLTFYWDQGLGVPNTGNVTLQIWNPTLNTGAGGWQDYGTFAPGAPALAWSAPIDGRWTDADFQIVVANANDGVRIVYSI